MLESFDRSGIEGCFAAGRRSNGDFAMRSKHFVRVRKFGLDQDQLELERNEK